MLTYQLQSRVFKIEEGEGFTFPDKAEIELKLGPATAFGTDVSPSRTVVRARAFRLTINANTGRWLGKSDPPLEQLEVFYQSPESKLSLSGDSLCYQFECQSLAQLDSTLTALKWILPSLLNLEFGEPPIVLYVRGRVGRTKFR
jgi:hypothetical protein